MFIVICVYICVALALVVVFCDNVLVVVCVFQIKRVSCHAAWRGRRPQSAQGLAGTQCPCAPLPRTWLSDWVREGLKNPEESLTFSALGAGGGGGAAVGGHTP